MIRLLTLLLLAIVSFGCRGSSDGRIPLAGTVTYNGKPITFGTIMFDPDISRGNTDSVQGSADIVDGKYKTLNNFGPQKGAYIARVNEFDGNITPEFPQGNSMCLDVRILVVLDPDTPLNIDLPAAK